jgi:hypothetical protein
VLLGTGDGAFGPARNSPLPGGQTPTSFVAGDMNGDGRLDFVAVAVVVYEHQDPLWGYFSYNFGDYTTVLLGRGDGSFAAQGTNLVGTTYPFHVALGDFNGDGRSDLVTLAAGRATLQLGQSNGAFQAPTVVATGVVGPVNIADLNGDGRLDFMMNVAAPFRVLAPAALGVALGNGNGTFRVSVLPNGILHSWAAALGDFNHDGRLDVLRMTSDGTISVLLGNGDGTFQTGQDVVVGTGATPAVAVGDFNGDGWLDVATLRGLSLDATILSVLLNDRHW